MAENGRRELVSTEPICTFNPYVSYSQIAVFAPELENPFNDWSDDRVAQGFSWRRESVSFRTLDESGHVATTVFLNKSPLAFSDDAIRVIRVPLFGSQTGAIEIATITESTIFKLSEGEYSLIFATGRKENGSCWIKFILNRDENVSAAILKADAELTKVDELLMDASPAG